ncbi:hypothetical protein KY331_04825, partial [Candidatus Woesearchaeota archaeon]|nr:hypothetical protein [Candidatus Woesearchaeota archaeon]
PNHFEYWVAGAYLEFDYGHQDWDPGYDHFGFRHQLPIKSLFVCIEKNKGQRVNRVLLAPFIDCFGLDEKQAQTLEDMLSDKKGTFEIMEALGVPKEEDVDRETDEDLDRFRYSLKFRRQLNEMIHLDNEPDIKDLFDPSWVHYTFKDGKLIIEDQTQTIFSEADFVLLSTLAYGPMLN